MIECVHRAQLNKSNDPGKKETDLLGQKSFKFL